MTSSSAVNRHRERFVRSNNNLRVSKKLASASRGHHHGVEIVVISSLTSCSSCSSSSDHKLVEGCNGGASVNLPPISSKTSGGGCNNRLTTRLQHQLQLQHPPQTNQQQLQVQTYSTRYHRSKSTTSNDRRLPYSSPTTFGERKNKSKKDVTMVGDSMTSSPDNNKLHTLSPNSFSASWPNTKGSSCKTTTITSSYTSSAKTSGLPSYKDESDVIITKHKQPTTTPRTTRTTTTKSGKSSTTKKQRLPRKTATGKKTTKNNNNENKSPEVNPATEQPEVVGDVTADDVIVTVSDGLEYYDDLEDRCRRWIADVARERLEHPDKIFLPHLLLP